MTSTAESIKFTGELIDHVRTRLHEGYDIGPDLPVLSNLILTQSKHLHETSRALLENAQGLVVNLDRLSR